MILEIENLLPSQASYRRSFGAGEEGGSQFRLGCHPDRLVCRLD